MHRKDIVHDALKNALLETSFDNRRKDIALDKVPLLANAVESALSQAGQKADLFTNIERWWHGILQSGEPDFPIYRDRGGPSPHWSMEPISCKSADLRDSYSAWMRGCRYDGDELRDFEIGKRLTLILPEIRSTQRRGTEGKRYRYYAIPSLTECRASFERWLGSEITWPRHDEAIIMEEEDDFHDDLLSFSS